MKSETPTLAETLAEKIAIALLTPHGGAEGTRLAIRRKLPDGTERDLGGNCKQSVVRVIERVIAEHTENATAQASADTQP